MCSFRFDDIMQLTRYYLLLFLSPPLPVAAAIFMIRLMRSPAFDPE